MKSIALLGLAGLAANVQAHSEETASTFSLGKRGAIDLERFRLPQLSEYTDANTAETSEAVRSLVKRETYVESAEELVRLTAPNAEFRLVEDHYVGKNGIAHVNFRQTVHGIDIDNADFNVNVNADGSIFSFGNSFYDGEIPESPIEKRDFSDPIFALEEAVSTLGLPVEIDAPVLEEQPATERYIVKGVTGTVSDPEARLVYFRKADGSLALTWRLETDVMDNWLLTYVDANSQEIYGVVDYVSDIATFEVYPWPVIDPTKGSRSVLEDPWLIPTSEFTWLSDGTNYTTTRGNNGVAQSNPSGRTTNHLGNYRPNDPELTFNYPFSLSETNATAYWDASITQLFYTSNKYHDVLYLLGFTEAAGNFEHNNNGQGGSGSDSVILNTQDGSGMNNANFATPADGKQPRMRMYLFNSAPILRDSSFDAGVVIHEYTHGLSNRLTGGPANAGCLSGTEAGGMGEGWSDFYAVAISVLPDATRSDNIPMGDWISNRPEGIRTHIYSTDMAVNPLTYVSANGVTRVHDIGTIWATMLFEVLWNLIDRYGKSDADYPVFDANGVPTDGKFLALQLVTDGLALQPCTPNFVSARNAILDADRALTGGDNLCEIWTGFAKRGLGENARYSSTTRTQDFTIPSGVC
ncbi:hypothetical protein S7711_01995 [Stachybotrys chartarum IBT 7711]|uniref:Extracellular metalloproteinase n=1 Tax=Stachybotrys chartarum (strain CBS 109288 / IBT 7711) TaxID=1280523 RepID=A0A084AVX4_STACB|nr:hypothetical protein S7711_01995 [Stachybotrys chartarum IBT 7711]KFA47368.1 hypothetical protein S40293_07591 [Stachybotrys chartarum IBT 40293]KFA78279.1 hypothetical protein S40288_02686 [Stachybotrys chartarum IBT 40288]